MARVRWRRSTPKSSTFRASTCSAWSPHCSISAVEAGGRDLDLESLDVAELVLDCCRSMTSSADRAGSPLRITCRECAGTFRRSASLRANSPSPALERGQVHAARRTRHRPGEARRRAHCIHRARDRDRRTRSRTAPGRRSLPSLLGGPPAPEKSDGFGLSVVRSLVGLHQGRISIASTPGDGMSVTVSLPVEAGRTRRATPPMDSIVPPPRRGSARPQDRMIGRA